MSASFERKKGRHCAIKGCNSSKNSIGSDFHLYRLPAVVDIRNKWCQFIANENGGDWRMLIGKNLFLCSSHFSKDQRGLKKLKLGAVPGTANDSNPNIPAKTNNNSAPSPSISKINCDSSVVSHAFPSISVDSNSSIPLRINNNNNHSTSENFTSVIEIDLNSAVNDPQVNLATTVQTPVINNQSSVDEADVHNTELTVNQLVTSIPIENVYINDQQCEPNLNLNADNDYDRTLFNDEFGQVLEYIVVDNVLVPIENVQDNTHLETIEHKSDQPTATSSQSEASSSQRKQRTRKCSVILQPQVNLATTVQTPVNNNQSSVDEADIHNTELTVNQLVTSIPIENAYINDQQCEPNLNLNADNDYDRTLFNDEFGQVLEYIVVDNVLVPIENVQDNTHLETIEHESDQPTATSSQSEASSSQRKQRTRKCSAKGCVSKHKRKFFTFPPVVSSSGIIRSNLDRCKMWIQNCGNPSLLEIPTRSLNSKHYICTDHFADDQFYNDQRMKLLPSAVPTQFTCDPLRESDMEIYPIWEPRDIVTESINDKFDVFQMNFEQIMDSLKWVTCRKCKEKFYRRHDAKEQCIHSKNICPTFSAENDMDPMEVPPELRNLTYVEEQLIARVHPLISIFKLKGHGQYGYRGNIINFPQNVKSIATTLPHTINDLSSLITVRTSDTINPVDFHVRAGVVKDALKWLVKNNPYYFDVHISEENLNSLPNSGNVFENVTCIVDDTSITNGTEEPHQGEDDDEITLVRETGIPMFGQPSFKDKAEVILNWPEMGKDAINEFKTPGYIVMAFPCLFPYGKADLRTPREKNVSPLRYFQHLMRYEDERFAKHPRFRYFALNSTMRWSALKNGGLFVQKNSRFKDMNIGQLKEELEKNPNLIKQLYFYNNTLRGTKSYWHARGQELLAMVEQLGLPTFFFTLSAADLHWPALFHFLSPTEDIETMTEARRRKLIEENPLKVDSFFMERGEAFISEVLHKKYNIKDHWYRLEYQHRGSPHIHGVLWLDDAPKFSDISTASEDEILKIVDYFDKFISTNNPDTDCPAAPVHPSRKRLVDVLDLDKDIAEVLNKVQRHTKCNDSYCIRKNKQSGKMECRFKFPIETRAVSELVITNEKDVQLLTARNDRLLNKYNPYMIQTWRANMDISPVLSKRALVNYLTKYITKSETQSKDLTETLKSLMVDSDQNTNVKSVIQRLYIQSCCERDISAQESCHLLMGLPLCKSGGRNFVKLNFKVLEGEAWVSVAEDDTQPSKSYIEKYLERPEKYETMSLMNMAKKFILPRCNRHPKGKEAIVQVYPKLSKNGDHNIDQYYRQQVLLHVPWRYEDEILDKYGSWEHAFNMNKTLIEEHSKTGCNLDSIQPDDPEYETNDIDETHMTEEFMYLSKMGPSQTAGIIELGRRDLDKAYNWHECDEKYETFGGWRAMRSFIPDQKKKTANLSDTAPTMPTVNFTTEQETVLKLLKLQIQSIKETDTTMQQDFSLPRSVIVQGKAGTGKSLLIHAMKTMIYKAFGVDAVALLGPTGVSALNINGSTVHSKLIMNPKSKELLPLKGALREFQQKFQKTLFVIVDEYSMIGCGMLKNIELRLREALDKENLEYGGVFIYFFGDVQQLAPVGDSPVYSNSQQSANYIHGKLLYHNIDASITLTQVKRQSDLEFQNVLHHISTGQVTEKDYKILQKRFITSVSSEDRSSFLDAIRLYPKKIEVETHNNERLLKLKNKTTGTPVPVARIPARHNCIPAKNGTENDAGGLRSVLYLAKGAKIMLRANLWTEKGLVNGVIGEIVDILYAEGANPPEDPPEAIVCKFNSYKGPYLDENEKTVVIQPLLKQWRDKTGKECTREQFPISLCYACSIHKSQGLTLEKAHISIGALKEMSAGLTYTALSRVKSVAGLLLEPFSKQRLLSLNNKDYIKRRMEWINHLSTKVITNLIS